MDELSLTLDHVTLSVANIESARAFYASLLEPLGLEVVGEYAAGVAYVGFGRGRKGTLWLAEKGQQSPPFHLCFRAPSREAVRAFHALGLAAGGKDHGAPGIRSEYHEEYYAAFVLDLEGHNIEAVCFEAEAQEPST